MPTMKYYESQVLSDRIIQRWGYVANPGEKFVDNNPYFSGKRYWSKQSPVPDSSVDVSHLINQVYPTDQEYNRLYDKIREKVTGPKGELLTSMVEWKSSLGMITSRVGQLSAAYSAVKKLQFAKAGKILRMTPKRIRSVESQIMRKKVQFSPTSAWLEYWMGWAPLHGDITHALTVIAGVPSLSEHFSVGTLIKRPENVVKIGDNFDNIETKVKVVGKVSAYGNFRVTNHNHVILNQLGLINLPLTAWQLVPFSFIVDWFANVATVVGSLTDFVGFQFIRTGYALKATITAVGKRVTMVYDKANSTYYVDIFNTYIGTAKGVGYYRKRMPGPIQAPRLEVKMLDKLSLTRALTSISLLTEIFLKKR